VLKTAAVPPQTAVIPEPLPLRSADYRRLGRDCRTSRIETVGSTVIREVGEPESPTSRRRPPSGRPGTRFELKTRPA